MSEIVKLNEKNLHSLPKEVVIPGYERSIIKAGIAHIGVGAFHRSHEAVYTDKLLHHEGNNGWGICGICLLERDIKIYKVLSEQNGLYTLMNAGPDGNQTANIIGP